MNKIIFRLSLLIVGLLAGASIEASAWNRMNMIPNPTEVSDSNLTFEEAYSLAMQVDKEPKYKGLTLLEGTYMQTVEPEKQVLAKDIMKGWLLDFYKGNEFIKDEKKVLKYLRNRYYIMSFFARLKEEYPFVKLTDWKYDFSDLYKMSSSITSRYQLEWNFYSERSFNFDRAHELLSKADKVFALVKAYQKRLQQNYISNPSKKVELDQFVAAGYKEDNSTYVDYFKRLHGSTESMQVASGDSLNLYALAIYESKDMSDAEKKKLLYAICKDSEKGLPNEWAKANEYIKEKFYKTYYATKKTPTLAALGINVDIEDGILCWHPFDVDLREAYNAYKDLRKAEDNLNFDLILNDRVIFEIYGQLINPLIEDKDVKKIVKKAGGSLYHNYKHYKDDDVQKEIALIDDEPIDFDNFSEDVVNAYKKSYSKRGDIKPLNYSEKTIKQYLYIALCELVSKDPVLSEKYPQCAKILKVDFTSASLKRKVESCRSAYKKFLANFKLPEEGVTFEDLSFIINLPVYEERNKLVEEKCLRILNEDPKLKVYYGQHTRELDEWTDKVYEETKGMKITKDMFEDMFKIAYEKKMDLQYDTHYLADYRLRPNKIIYYNDSIMYIKSRSYNEVTENIWYKLKDGRWCKNSALKLSGANDIYSFNSSSDIMTIYPKELIKEMIPFLGDETTSSDGRIFVGVLGKRRIPIEMKGTFYKKKGLVERKDFSEEIPFGKSIRFTNAEVSLVQRPGEDINDYILARGTDYTAANGPKEVWDTMPWEEYKKLSDKADDAQWKKESSAIYAKYGKEQVLNYWKNDKTAFIGMTWKLFKGEYLPVYGGDVIKENSNGDRVVRQYRLSHYRYFYFYNGKLHHWVDK